jgi:quinol monooxygenase YgiN
MKIVIAGKVAVKPEQRAEAIRVALAMAEATRAEPGCVEYRFSTDLGDPDSFCIFEEWDDEEALERHFRTEHMKVFQQALPKLLAGGVVIRRYAVASVGDM